MVTEKGTFKFVNTTDFIHKLLAPLGCPPLVIGDDYGNYRLKSDPEVQLVVSDHQPRGAGVTDEPTERTRRLFELRKLNGGLPPPWE